MHRPWLKPAEIVAGQPITVTIGGLLEAGIKEEGEKVGRFEDRKDVEGRKQKTEYREQRTDDRRQILEVGSRNAEVGKKDEGEKVRKVRRWEGCERRESG